MNIKKRLIYLILNLAAVSLITAGTAIFFLYDTAFDQQRERLMETARSQARLIESVARFNIIHIDEDFEGGPESATLQQITDAHRHFKGFGKSGELVLARLENAHIHFLLNHRHFKMDKPEPVPLSSHLAQPMRLALRGKSGTIVARDYRGVRVLAAYEPVAVINNGIVAKIDLSEIRAPFLEAAQITGFTSLVLIAIGTAIFLLLFNPMIENLQENEMRYRQLFDSAADMIFLHDPDSEKLVDINPIACRILGYSRSELLSRSSASILAGKKSQEEFRRLTRAVRNGGSTETIAPLLKKDGAELETELRLMPVTIGIRNFILGIGRDLTAQNKLERRTRAFYQAFRNSNDFMFYTDKNGIILDVNDAFIRRFGYKREEAVGRTPRIIRSPSTEEATYSKLWKEILDPNKGFWRGRISNRTKSGEDIPILLSITAVRDDAFEIIGFVSNAVDLAEQEELQRRLRQSESLAAVGSMAAVVAHEIRNPLGSIVTAASSISRKDLPEEDKTTLLQIIREESKRLNDTLSQFLQYARPRDPKLEKQDINRTLEEILSMIRSDPKTLGKVKIDLKLDTSLRSFPFDGDQIRQVAWNIILNALQSMGGKGTLTLETSSHDGNVRLAIIDDGPGIPKEDRDKIFQPFHTTKQKGTGLGLPVAERIVSAHGGTIDVEGRSPRGAVFTITLPARMEDA